MTTTDTPQTASFSSPANTVSLDTLPLGSRCRIIAVDENSESLLRLMEMGLTPGAEATLEREAPFFSPLSLRLSGCTLAVRREDARRILVEPLPEASPRTESSLRRP
jgi:ferrous iron transport protein A